MDSYHIPVMVAEVMRGLAVKRGGWYIDATVGGGGYAREVLRLGGKVIGIDADVEAIERTKASLSGLLWKESYDEHIKAHIYTSSEVILVHANFRYLSNIIAVCRHPIIDGVIFDLGVSSYQIDTAERGFSYRTNAVLDLQFDRGKENPAWKLIDQATEEELYEFFIRYGEEELARPIAHAFVLARSVTEIRYTKQIVDIVSSVVPARVKYETLSRIFQALRIVVNDELSALKNGLSGAINALRSTGRVAVLSYHSLEDRIVKLRFRWQDVRIIVQKPITPALEERQANNRSRSAKLRIAEKL